MKNRLRIFWYGLGGLFVVLGIVSVTFHYGPRVRVEAYKKELRASGEKLEVSDFIPPPVLPEQNGAEFILAAGKITPLFRGIMESNPPSAMRMVAPGKAMIGWAQPDVRDELTNTWEEVITELGASREILALLEQAMERPKLDFGLNYQDSYLLLPHLSKLKSGVQTLAAAALCDLHQGDIGSAIVNIRTALALVRGMQNERLAISQLVRIAIAHFAFTANWELLQSTNLNEGQLAQLQKSWEEFEFIEAAEFALLMERAMGVDAIQKMRSSGPEFQRMAGLYRSSGGSSPMGGSGDWLVDAGEFIKDGWESARGQGTELIWRGAWSYSDELLALKGYQVLLSTARFARTNQYFQPALGDGTNKLASMGIRRLPDDDFSFFQYNDIKFFFSRTIQAMVKISTRVVRAEFARRAAITVIALKRYQLKHGRYPATLTELTPDFLEKVLVDPVDGAPLRYRLNPDGTFLLYSIGENGVDDGGDPRSMEPASRPPWQYGRDLVWPQPATPAEIEKFHQDRAAERK